MTGRGRTVGEARILALVTLGVLVTSASITILSVSLPVVVGYFRASALQSTWLLLIPFVVTTALLVPLGRVADTVGQRTMFLAGMSLFTVCTAGSGLAWSMGALLVLAVLQAIGAAMVLCVTGAIIGAVFAGSRLGWAMGVYLAGLSVSQVIAPIAGGLVAEGLGWRWVFWIQVPLAVLCLPLGSRFLRELPSRPGRRRSRADVVGGLVLVAAVGTLVVALTAIQESGPADLLVIVAAVVFLALVPVLAVVEARASDPILPLNLLRRRSFLFANLANMVSTLPRFVPVTAVALYLQAVVGDTAFVAGLKLAPLPVAMTAGSLVAAPIASRTSLPSAGILGSALMAAGLGLLVGSVELGWPYGADLAAFGALGLGAGIFGTVVSTLIVREAPAADLGTVNGLRLTLMILGEACAMAGGLAILTSPLPAAARSDFYQARLAGSLTEALVDAFVALSVVMIVASLAGGAALLAAESGRTATRSEDKFMHSSTTKE